MTPILQVDTAGPRRPVAPMVFLSHATKDKDRFVDLLAERLRERGIRVWMDRGEIRPGDSMVQRVFGEGIDRADAVVVVLSRHSADSPWMRAEIDAAVIRRIYDGIRVLVIRLDDAPVPPELRAQLHVEVDAAADWTAQLVEIVATLTGTRMPAYGRIRRLRRWGAPGR
jgi:hypothetical protein